MKWKWLLIPLSCAALALSPAERTFVDKARAYMAQAKVKVEQQDKVLKEESRRAQQAEQTVSQQSGQIGKLGGEIDTAHKNESAAVEFNKYSKPIIDQVNSYWGLGAFLYGFKVLARHLLILAAVLIVAALIVFGLSFAFPPIGAFLRTAGEVIAAFIRKIGDRFRRK